MTFFFLLFGIGTSGLAAQNLGPDHLKNIIDLQSISLKKINSSLYIWDENEILGGIYSDFRP